MKAVALPAEHGGWGFLAEPVILGLVLAPSAAGVCLALAGLGAFLGRHPLRLLLLDRRKGVHYPRTALAERVAAGFALLALLLLAGAVALGASATAIALSGGAADGPAWSAWALLALRAATSVLYVRARIRLARGLAAGPRAVHVGHAAALVAAMGLAGAGWAPWLAPLVFLVLLTRSGWGLSSRRRPVRPQTLGFQELGYGLLTLVLLAVGYRLGP